VEIVFVTQGFFIFKSDKKTMQMINRILFFLMCLTPSFLEAQNLVLNPSFEQADHCITEGDVSKYSNVPSLYLAQCKNWASFSDQGTADLFQPCNDWAASSYNDASIARTGVAFAGFYVLDSLCCDSEYREYIVGKLKTGLERGKNYEVSFWVLLLKKSTHASSSIGVYFSRDTVYTLDDFYGVAPFQPQLQNARGNFLTSKTQWTEVRFSYKAQGGEKFIMIGNFLDDVKTESIKVPNNEKRGKIAYYQIDDVCVSAQNCTMDIKLPEYEFRTYVYDENSNVPLEGSSVEMSTCNQKIQQLLKTESDGKARFSLVEGRYLCYTKAPCYLPKFDFYYVPMIMNGRKMPEQMQYIPLMKVEPKAKIILADEISLGMTFTELQAKGNIKMTELLFKLDKITNYLKENPRLKVCFNSGIYLGQVFSEDKKIIAKQRSTDNLEYIRKYLLEKGISSNQFSVKLIELTRENPGITGKIDGISIGRISNRYELEVVETDCKSDDTDFFKDNKKIYVLDKVFFTPDSPELEQRSFEELDKLSVYLRQNENLKIRINGHTDIGRANGSDKFLQDLSDNRAKAVAEYLISKGAKRANISWQGFANRKPIADNNTEAGKAQNRRVEVEIIEF
jgi:outer membrane protein OmpA-like peptidoglycan-associated protein